MRSGARVALLWDRRPWIITNKCLRFSPTRPRLSHRHTHFNHPKVKILSIRTKRIQQHTNNVRRATTDMHKIPLLLLTFPDGRHRVPPPMRRGSVSRVVRQAVRVLRDLRNLRFRLFPGFQVLHASQHAALTFPEFPRHIPSCTNPGGSAQGSWPSPADLPPSAAGSGPSLPESSSSST